MTASEVVLFNTLFWLLQIKEEKEEKSHKMNYWLVIVFRACLLPDVFQEMITFWLVE